MPLIGNERDATAILIRRIRKEGGEGLQNFARLVLGAHQEQAKRLTDAAILIHEGSADWDSFEFADAANIQVTREVDGKELSVTLKADKLPITSYQELVDFYEIDTTIWTPTQQTFNFWGSESSPNFQVKAVFRENDYYSLTDADREATRKRYAERAISPYKAVWAEGMPSGNLLEIMIADLHAGRNIEPVEQTVDRLIEAVRAVVSRAIVAVPIERIALVFNGDTFNDDNGKRTTTGGTPQESGERWQDVYVAVRDAIAALAIGCAEQAPVDLYVIEGNHDRERSFYLADSLHGLLSNYQPRITVHTDTLRNYIDWGVVTLGLAHGDQMKPLDLAMTMLRETDSTGKAVYEWHLGHLHTRREDELHGVLLRRFRTPTPADDYHKQRGFEHNVKNIVGMVWNRDQGEIATFPYIFPGGSE